MIYESLLYHNVVFVGYDKGGVPRHAGMRGTGSESSYKGNAPNSRPEYSFHWNGTSRYLCLFESPIDMLSFISMHKDNWRCHSYIISKALGTRTVMTGSVSRSKNDPSQSLQMTERPLMTADELKSMKKGSFIVMKTGAHPFVSQLKLFMKWGISFPEDAYTVEDRGARKVRYISREKLIRAITDKYPPKKKPKPVSSEAESGGQIMTEPAEATPEQELNHIAEQAKTAKPLRTG